MDSWHLTGPFLQGQNYIPSNAQQKNMSWYTWAHKVFAKCLKIIRDGALCYFAVCNRFMRKRKVSFCKAKGEKRDTLKGASCCSSLDFFHSYGSGILELKSQHRHTKEGRLLHILLQWLHLKGPILMIFQRHCTFIKSLSM